MKKTLFAAALMFVASNAMASQARMDAVQGSRTVADDFTRLFLEPSKMWSGDIKDQVLFEDSTGGFIMSSGDSSKWGLYLGKQSSILDLFTAINGAALAAPFATINNPLHVFYGADMGGNKLGFNFYYANSKEEGTNPEFTQSFMGLAAGIEADGWNANLAMGLGGSMENTTANEKYTAKSNMKLNAEYDLSENSLVFLEYTTAAAEKDDGTVTEGKQNAYALGYERGVSKDGAHFFYGVKYVSDSTEVGATKTDKQNLPLYFGVEAAANSWLTLRGAYSQHVLIGSEKTGNATETMTTASSYTAGAAVTLGNFMIDGSINIGNNAANNFGGGNNDWMTNAALTYNF